MPALEWQKRFEMENPGLKAFEIDLSDKQACGLPPGPEIIPMKVITPNDVIDRIGLRVQVQRTIDGVEAASMAEGERIMENGVPHQSPPCSPRLGTRVPLILHYERNPSLLIHSHGASKTSSQKLGLLGTQLLQNAVGVQVMQGDQEAQKTCSGPRVQLHQCLMHGSS